MTREEEIADLVSKIKRLLVERDDSLDRIFSPGETAHRVYMRERQLWDKLYYELRYRLQLVIASDERGSIRYMNPITHAHVHAADELLNT